MKPLKDKNRSLVSVVIPAYNSEKFIAETLDSVLAQTYRPIEVIVVDDGSTDRTADIVKKYETRFAGSTNPTDSTNKTSKTSKTTETGLTYLYQKNCGPSAARNSGMAAARGDYIAFLDADDCWLPHTLERLTGYMESHPGVSLVFGDAGSFGPGGVLFPSAFAKFGCPEQDNEGVVQKAFERLLEGNFILTGTVLVKKECLDRLGGFNEALHYGEDYDLWVRIALFERIGCLREPVMKRRVHDTNLSKNEARFHDAKISFMENFAVKYAARIREMGVDFDRHMLKAMKKRSYRFYLRRDYARFLASVCGLCIHYLKSRFSGQGVA
jgi:glycosyltransferase involved in cell wall biosynthesis